MNVTRRAFLRFHAGAGMALVFAAGCRHGSKPIAFTADSLATLSAAAEALVPTTETPGADAAWAGAFITTRLRSRPDLAPGYAACARSLDAAAKARAGIAFAAQTVPEREATIRSLCPSLSMHADKRVPAEQLELRRPLNELLVAFFASDHVGIDDPTYGLEPPAGPPRDPSTPSPGTHTLCGRMPDEFISHKMATQIGAGDYNRAWAAAGFASPRGVCKSAEEITKAPTLGG